jgi:hypothetical protein
MSAKQLYAEFSSICIRQQWRRQCSGIVSNNAAPFFSPGYERRPIHRVTLSVIHAFLRTFRQPTHLTCRLDNWRQLHNRSAPDRLCTGLAVTSRSVKSYVFRLKKPSSGYSVHRNSLIMVFKPKHVAVYCQRQRNLFFEYIKVVLDCLHLSKSHTVNTKGKVKVKVKVKFTLEQATKVQRGRSTALLFL